MGTGYLPAAPGTWASALVCVIFLVAAIASRGSELWLNTSLAILALLSSAGCVGFGCLAERAFGGKDPPRCTIDEWAGQAVALLALPFGQCSRPRDWLVLTGLAFVVFRLFDIIKLPPGRQLEKVAGGWGILLDDVVAGVYANVVCQLVLRLAVFA